MEFLNIICQTFTDNIDILKITMNEEVNDEQFLDTIIDSLKQLNENIEEVIECILELINRMKKLRLKKMLLN